MKKKATRNSKVKIHYHGTTHDSEYLVSNTEKEALEFTIGSGCVPAALEQKIIGMSAGEKRVFTIPPEDGFGKRKRELVTTAEKSDFPDQTNPQVGKKYRLRFSDGSIRSASVTAVNGEQVTLDANHPLAGRTLTIKVKLLEVV